MYNYGEDYIKYSWPVMISITTAVVIRFQVCIFDILNTANQQEGHGLAGCDSLSSLYL